MRPSPVAAALAAMLLLVPTTRAVEPAAPLDLGWLAGAWCEDKGEERIEEAWLPPVAGEMVGVGRVAKGGRTTMYEFMAIRMAGGVQTFYGQPRGVPATAFPRTGGGAGWIRFENTAHDFPQRIEYRRVDEALLATISGPGGDGKTMEVSFRYSRCPR